MRQDKLTTKFTEALSDAQSLALGNDNAYIEPVHLLAAMLRQEDGPRALLERAGVNVPGLSAGAENAIKRLPQVQGNDGIQVGPELAKLLQATEKEAIKRGATNYLCKPADADDVLTALLSEHADLTTLVPENPMSVDRLQWEHIQRVLAEHDGNISATARALGMHRRTLQRKLQKRPVRR